MSDQDEIPTEEGLFSLIGRHTKKIGRDAAEHTLKLWYTINASTTPTVVKAPLIAALVYVGCPIDLIPDVTPVLGFTDDVAVITAALAAAHLYVTDDVVTQAKAATRRIFD